MIVKARWIAALALTAIAFSTAAQTVKTAQGEAKGKLINDGQVAGSGSEPRYTNSVLPTMGVILVTINYRLNVFCVRTNNSEAA